MKHADNNSFQKARKDVGSGQTKNKEWWESLPMTYVDWGVGARSLSSKTDFKKLEENYLDSNPWFKNYFDFSLLSEKNILEIGCGAGTAACLFARSLRGGGKVTAIDITEQAVILTQNNARLLDVPIDVQEMDAENLQFGDATFDFVFSWGALHHSEYPEKAFKEVSRVLKPNGKGLIMVYNRESLRFILKGFYQLLFKGKKLQGYNLDSVQQFFTDGYFHKHFRKKQFVQALNAVGL